MKGLISVDHPKELTHISLCAGYGGIDLGIKRALRAIRTIAFSEIEAYACENLVAKIEAGLLDPAPIWTNLKTFPWQSFRDRVDILSGGFPCQPFSAAGRRAGDSDPRHLWPFITKGIRELGYPPVVFFENVEGIISSKLKGSEWADPEGTPVLLHVLRELERLGYNATAGVFSAREVGLPHQRKRVFIMGVRSDLSEAGREIVDRLLRETESASRESGSGTAYPAPRGAEQFEWEPPRVTMGNAMRGHEGSYGGEHRVLPKTREQGEADRPKRTSDAHTIGVTMGYAQQQRSQRAAEQYAQGQAEPTMGGDADGAPRWMDYAELCYAVDNRTDELRLLGNGVVPATAERAFRFLWESLAHAAR